MEPKERLTQDTVVNILKEAVQTSCQWGAEHVSETAGISRQTVKNIIHSLKFPLKMETGKKKKRVDYLYIDTDEDHAALQFREKKSDLIKISMPFSQPAIFAP